MNSLRAKLAILLVVVIVSVVGLLTALLLYFLAPPGPRHPMQPIADVVETLARAATHPGAVALASNAPQGRMSFHLTDRLRAELRRRGSTLMAEVYSVAPDWSHVVATPLEGRGWLIVPILDLPPPGEGLSVIIRWLALLTIGAAAIALFVANRMVRPLVLLESTVESVGPDAILPVLPEEGPAEVRATAKAINSLSARLKSAVESRMRLVAAAGHDLRTPITRLRLRVEFIADQEEKEAWLRDIDELERIADSAIQLVREESEKAPVQELDLGDLVRQIASDLRDQGLDVEVTDAETVTVRTGRLALSRALRNLIINAATHGVRARVSIKESNGKALVVVSDEGPGIPEDMLGRVFEPFFRADPARRQSIPGAGLGLTIAHEIIQRAGGTIRIRNAVGRGLVQEVELPATEVAS